MHFSPSLLALATSLFAQVGAPTASELLPLTDPHAVSLGPIPGDEPDPDHPRIAWPLIEMVERDPRHKTAARTALKPLPRRGARKYLAQRRREFAADLKRPEYTARNRAARRALARKVCLAPA